MQKANDFAIRGHELVINKLGIFIRRMGQGGVLEIAFGDHDGAAVLDDERMMVIHLAPQRQYLGGGLAGSEDHRDVLRLQLRQRRARGLKTVVVMIQQRPVQVGKHNKSIHNTYLHIHIHITAADSTLTS